MVVIMTGFGVLVYSGAVLTSLLLSGDLTAALVQQRKNRMRDQLHGHVIVVDYGRVGRSVVTAARKAGYDCVVVDADLSKEDAINNSAEPSLCLVMACKKPSFRKLELQRRAPSLRRGQTTRRILS